MKFEVTVTIDPAAWADEYGISVEEAIKDAQDYIPTLIKEDLDLMGSAQVILNAEVRLLPEEVAQ